MFDKLNQKLLSVRFLRYRFNDLRLNPILSSLFQGNLFTLTLLYTVNSKLISKNILPGINILTLKK